MKKIWSYPTFQPTHFPTECEKFLFYYSLFAFFGRKNELSGGILTDQGLEQYYYTKTRYFILISVIFGKHSRARLTFSKQQQQAK